MDAQQNAQIASVGQQAESAMGTVVDLSRELRSINQRIARLELTLEALVRLLGHRSGLGREELALMVQRIDLADGIEDGAMGPDASARAPKCVGCGRPVNPHRSACIYCNAALSMQAKSAPVPTRTIRCVSCGKGVPESESYFSERGVVCEGCFSG